jgi:hypothetical protein
MADDKRADNGKRADDRKFTERSAPEEMTPSPTQAQLDEVAGGKERKAEARKAPEALPPTPTQAENDEVKAKMCGMEVEKKPEAKKDAKAAEDLTPALTQAENDAAKLAAMPGETPPAPSEGSSAGVTQHRRQVEASRPGAYQTRSSEPVTAKAE